MELPDIFRRYRNDISSELVSTLGDSSLGLYDMMRYHLGWIDERGRPQDCGGRLVRPTLLLLACEAVGGSWRKALPAAAAVELVHNFSLIHDDIEDEDRQRRQRDTVWCLWGQPQAINAGDAMHSLARLAISRLDGSGVDAGRTLRAARILDQTCLELCEGQYQDISFESQIDINIEGYLQMIERKTASLFGCCLQLGALLGTADEALVERFHRCGRRLGLAYQMLDDCLGIWGGKSTSDIQKRKKTLPVIYALGQAPDKERGALRAIYTQESLGSAEVERVLAILDRLGADEYARVMAMQYCSQALEELDGAGLAAEAQRELRQAIDFLMSRES